MNDAPQLLKVSEVARHLAVCEWTVRKLMREGDLAYIKVGKCVRFTTDELRRYVERQQD